MFKIIFFIHQAFDNVIFFEMLTDDEEDFTPFTNIKIEDAMTSIILNHNNISASNIYFEYLTFQIDDYILVKKMSLTTQKYKRTKKKKKTKII